MSKNTKYLLITTMRGDEKWHNQFQYVGSLANYIEEDLALVKEFLVHRDIDLVKSKVYNKNIIDYISTDYPIAVRINIIKSGYPCLEDRKICDVTTAPICSKTIIIDKVTFDTITIHDTYNDDYDTCYNHMVKWLLQKGEIVLVDDVKCIVHNSVKTIDEYFNMMGTCLSNMMGDDGYYTKGAINDYNPTDIPFAKHEDVGYFDEITMSWAGSFDKHLEDPNKIVVTTINLFEFDVRLLNKQTKSHNCIIQA